jgi:2-C-methyl-D-erythritol 4-phosphate cytidylyltransferase
MADHLRGFAAHQQHLPIINPTAVIIVAAGRGIRLGGDVAKSLRLLDDKPLFAHAMGVFDQIPEVISQVLVAPPDHIDLARDWVRKLKFKKTTAVVPGGLERGDSVQNGLKVVSPDIQWIAIHDGARPFVTPELFTRILKAAAIQGAAIPGIRLADTIKEIASNQIVRTISREQLRGAQTPQIFDRHRLKNAYHKAQEQGVRATDDAEIVQRFTDGQVMVVDGDVDNFKITTPEDWQRALDFMSRNLRDLRNNPSQT